VRHAASHRFVTFGADGVGFEPRSFVFSQASRAGAEIDNAVTLVNTAACGVFIVILCVLVFAEFDQTWPATVVPGRGDQAGSGGVGSEQPLDRTGIAILRGRNFNLAAQTFWRVIYLGIGIGGLEEHRAKSRMARARY
jgi:hypothetical protein